MRIFNDREPPTELRSLSDWEQMAGPVSKGHWKPDRSARELARDWIDGHAEQRVQALLSLHRDLRPVVLERAIAEKRTHFDDIGRGPRNHDLLVFGTAAPGRLVVGVEGKADEPFGETLAAYRAKKRSGESRAVERLERLTQTLFGKTPQQDAALGEIGYQLCSALAGTLADAKREGAEVAVLLVHEFRTAATVEWKHAANAASLELFLNHLRGAEPDREHERAGWIAGPWEVCGDGNWLPGSSAVYVAKLTTDLGTVDTVAARR